MLDEFVFKADCPDEFAEVFDAFYDQVHEHEIRDPINTMPAKNVSRLIGLLHALSGSGVVPASITSGVYGNIHMSFCALCDINFDSRNYFTITFSCILCINSMTFVQYRDAGEVVDYLIKLDAKRKEVGIAGCLCK